MTDLFTLQVHDGVLAAVLEAILVGGHGVVDQEASELIRAPRVHQVRQELDKLRPELFLALHVHVGEVPLAHLSWKTVFLTFCVCVKYLAGYGIQFGIVVGNHREDPKYHILSVS